MSRRLLQIVTGLLGIGTMVLGGIQLFWGIDSPVYHAVDLPESPILDSNLRFFGGMGLGLGAILIWIIPVIEKQKLLFRAVWICAILGGIGRLISAGTLGSPSDLLMGFTILEVLAAPLLIYWQHQIAKDLT